MQVVKICNTVMASLAQAIATAITDALVPALDGITSAGVVSHTYCGTNADGNPAVIELIYVIEADGSQSAQSIRDITNPAAPVTLTNLDNYDVDFSCCAADGAPEPVTGFNFTDFFAANSNGQDTKINLDDPGATNAYTDIGAPYSVADLVAQLNASAAGAVPPTVPSGIDYSATVFAVSATNPNVVVVTSGPVPTSIDLVSIPLSVTVTTV